MRQVPVALRWIRMVENENGLGDFPSARILSDVNAGMILLIIRQGSVIFYQSYHEDL